MSKDEALKLAIEALEEIALAGMSPAPEMIDSKEAFHARQAWRFIGVAARALEPIKEALAQPQQEPVAWELGAEVYWGDSPELSDYVRKEGTPLYTTPPQRTWVELTPEDYNEIFEQARTGEHAVQLAEAKLKEKNT